MGELRPFACSACEYSGEATIGGTMAGFETDNPLPAMCAGDVWLYSTPIVQASEVASCPARRRVLQIDFAARELPGGLEWLGV